ncbi:MAG: hypothetical protein ACTH1D_11495 [Mycobacteriaceae bacterium]|uniref:hypothetical protein n=1 Tax=Corynebacterium sp. TaxID=1720 RepID=UPI003F973E7C
MGSDNISALLDLVPQLSELLDIVLGLLKGDLSVLSTEGSVAGIFGSSAGE